MHRDYLRDAACEYRCGKLSRIGFLRMCRRMSQSHPMRYRVAMTRAVTVDGKRAQLNRRTPTLLITTDTDTVSFSDMFKSQRISEFVYGVRGMRVSMWPQREDTAIPLI